MEQSGEASEGRPAPRPEAGPREPTADELAKESAVFWPLAADVGITTLLLLFGVLTGSLTLVSEGVRSVVMLAASIYAVVVLRAVHRGRMTRFEYGVGKIERFVSIVVGLALLISGLWVAANVVQTVVAHEAAASPRGLATAAVVNAINAVINGLGWIAMVAARHGGSEVYRSQVRARFVMLSSSLVLQVTLTIAALAKDPVIALLLDALGASFVAVLMIVNGLRLVAHALPDLLDAPASAEVARLIDEASSRVIPPDRILRIRTRRTGAKTYAEVAVTGAAFASLAALQDAAAAIQESLRDADADVDLAVVVGRRPAEA